MLPTGYGLENENQLGQVWIKPRDCQERKNLFSLTRECLW